jgi:uncharacterized protein YegP (UPF0339 family)
MSSKRSPVQFLKSKSNQTYYIVRARNGKVLVQSEMFNTNRAALNGARALLKAMKLIDDPKSIKVNP